MYLKCGCEYHDQSEQQLKACSVEHRDVYVGVLRYIESLEADRDKYKRLYLDLIVDMGKELKAAGIL